MGCADATPLTPQAPTKGSGRAHEPRAGRRRACSRAPQFISQSCAPPRIMRSSCSRMFSFGPAVVTPRANPSSSTSRARQSGASVSSSASNTEPFFASGAAPSATSRRRGGGWRGVKARGTRPRPRWRRRQQRRRRRDGRPACRVVVRGWRWSHISESTDLGRSACLRREC